MISYTFPKRQRNQTLYLYSRVSLIWAVDIPTLHTNAHSWLDGTKKWSQVVCHSTHPSQSVPPTYQCILFRPPLLQWAILGPHNHHSTPSLVHQVVVNHCVWFFYLDFLLVNSRARMNILCIVKINTPILMKWWYEFYLSCWLLSLEILACYEHMVQPLITHVVLGGRS